MGSLTTNWATIHEDIMLEICKYLSIGNIKEMGLVSRHWLSVTNGALRSRGTLVYKPYSIPVFERCKRNLHNYSFKKLPWSTVKTILSQVKFLARYIAIDIPQDIEFSELFAFLNDLPELQKLRIKACNYDRYVYLRNKGNADQRIINFTSNITSLKLELESALCVESIIDHLQFFTNLKHFWIKYSRSCKEQIAQLIQNNSTTLISLNIHITTELDEFFDSEIPSLRKLDITDTITVNNMENIIKNYTNLRYLSLQSGDYLIADHHITLLCEQMKHLHTLKLTDCRRLTEACLIEFKKLKYLSSLDIRNARFYSDDPHPFTSASPSQTIDQLRELTISIGQCHNQLYRKNLQHFRNVRVLNLYNGTIVTSSYNDIAYMLPHLETLNFALIHIYEETSVVLPSVHRFENLKSLLINHSWIMCSDFLSKIVAAPNLRTLNATFAMRSSDPEIIKRKFSAGILAMLKNSPLIESFHVSHVEYFDDRTVEFIVNELKYLRDLYVHASKIIHLCGRELCRENLKKIVERENMMVFARKMNREYHNL